MKKVISILCPLIVMALSLCSCSDDNDSTPGLDKTEVTLYVEETITLTYSGGDCTWTSDNPLIASVENGIITANHVGETVIHANDANCKVIVKPHYTRFYEPYITWGEGKEKVKEYMKNYEIEKENSNQLAYKGSESTLYYAYTFENGKLNGSGFATELFESTYLMSYLLERYIPISNEGTTYIFMSPDKKTGIGLQIYSSYLMVGYVPSDSNTKSIGTTIQDILSDINQKIENTIKK